MRLPPFTREVLLASHNLNSLHAKRYRSPRYTACPWNLKHQTVFCETSAVLSTDTSVHGKSLNSKTMRFFHSLDDEVCRLAASFRDLHTLSMRCCRQRTCSCSGPSVYSCTRFIRIHTGMSTFTIWVTAPVNCLQTSIPKLLSQQKHQNCFSQFVHLVVREGFER